MLERPAISAPEIRALLASQYALGALRAVGEIAPLPGGSANCTRIACAEGMFVLKEFPSRVSAEEVAVEPLVAHHLRSRGVPAPRFVPTVRGAYVWTHRGRAFHLQEYVAGRIQAQHGAPAWLMRDSALLLGRLHNALADFPQDLKQAFGPAWFRWSADDHAARYGELIAAAEALPLANPWRDRVLADLRYKLDLLPRAAGIDLQAERLTYYKSHGDYSIRQLICGPSAIRAVIDLSAACTLPAAWEVIRSFTYADPRCAAGAIDAARLRAYALHYVSQAALTREDLAAMPYLYLLQLARSRYGYAEYLLTHPVEGEALIAFASWRTAMCRWLEAHVAELAGVLVGVVGR